MKIIHVISAQKTRPEGRAFLPREEIYQQAAFSASVTETTEASVDCHIIFFVITNANIAETAAVTAIVARRIISPPIPIHPPLYLFLIDSLHYRSAPLRS